MVSLLQEEIITLRDFTAGFLLDWDASDSARKQHSKWSPNCIFVAHNKGTEFVLHNTQVLKTAQGFLIVSSV